MPNMNTLGEHGRKERHVSKAQTRDGHPDLYPRLQSQYHFSEEAIPSLPHDTGKGKNGIAGRYQYQYQFLPAAVTSPSRAPSSPAAYSSFLVDRNGFEQEKVSVRLVENEGLVVVPDDSNDTSPESKSSCKHTCSKATGHYETEYDTTVASASASYFCTTGTTPLATQQKTSNSGGNKCAECKSSSLDRDNVENSRRHGGKDGCPRPVSSMTPLMDDKENRKILCEMNPLALKGTRDMSSFHMCCTLVFGVSASIFFSLTLLLAKVLKNRDHHPISIAFWRYLGILVLSVPVGGFYLVRGRKDKVLAGVWPIHDMDKAANALALLMRGVLGSTSVILRFCSLKYLTIADSSVISYCAPVFAAIFTPFCLKKDKGGFVPVVLGFVAGFGVFLVSRPPFLGGSDEFDNETLKGVFLGSLSMLCACGVFVIMRNLEKVHFSLMLFVLGIWGVFEAGVLALSLDVLKVPERLPDIVMMVGVGILTFFGQLFVLLAMKMGQVGSVSVMRSCDIFLSFLWQYLFLKLEPEPLGILSAFLVILAVWLVCFRKWVTTLRANNRLRNQLQCILY